MSKRTESQREPLKRVGFYPVREDAARIQIFENILSEEQGLPFRPTQRDLFHFILDYAEQGLQRRHRKRRQNETEAA